MVLILLKDLLKIGRAPLDYQEITQVGEFKALKENFDESQIKYLGFAAEEQVLLKILKK